jgi:hypothetical protein
MSAMTDSPVRLVNRQRAHSLRPGPARPVPDPSPSPSPSPSPTAPPWATEEAWDDRSWDEEGEEQETAREAAGQAASTVYHPPAGAAAGPGPGSGPSPGPSPVRACGPVPHPAPAPAPAQVAAPPCDGPAVPPRRTVAPFPPIRAGRGRHRLPSAVRRRPGPIAAGLMVAATTLAAGTLRLSAPLPVHTSAGAGHQCGPLRPGEPCE